MRLFSRYKRLYFNVSALHKNYSRKVLLQPVPPGSPYLSLVIPGYPWLSLVIPGYHLLSLVIIGYPCLFLVSLVCFDPNICNSITRTSLCTRFFKSSLAFFCKSKKCIIFNVDYCPGSKKSKFDMTLIIDSLFNIP